MTSHRIQLAPFEGSDGLVRSASAGVILWVNIAHAAHASRAAATSLAANRACGELCYSSAEPDRPRPAKSTDSSLKRQTELPPGLTGLSSLNLRLLGSLLASVPKVDVAVAQSPRPASKSALPAARSSSRRVVHETFALGRAASRASLRPDGPSGALLSALLERRRSQLDVPAGSSRRRFSHARSVVRPQLVHSVRQSLTAATTASGLGPAARGMARRPPLRWLAREDRPRGPVFGNVRADTRGRAAADYRLASLSSHEPTTTDQNSGCARKPSDS